MLKRKRGEVAPEPDRPVIELGAVDHDGPLLAVEDLHVEFRTRQGVAKAINGVSFSVDARETLAILGESGSGKSVTAMAAMGILDTPPGFVTGGQVRYRGSDLLAGSKERHREVRGRHMAMIFQDALSALNPVYTVGWQIAEMFRVHEGLGRKDATVKAIELLDRVRIPSAKDRIKDYPHQFSGGMRQRVMIAMSIALNPDVIIADEPTTALDVTVQAQIMDLLAEIQRDSGSALILITHDLGVVADVADRIAVMYAGRIVEEAPVHDIYANPAHPYTEGLLASIPSLEMKGQELKAIKGLPPNLLRPPPGCPFHPRCPYARPTCLEQVPPLEVVGPGRRAACLYWEEVVGER